MFVSLMCEENSEIVVLLVTKCTRVSESKKVILETYIQIKIAMSKDKLRILIKILAESHMAFDWEIRSTFRYTPTDRPAL